MGGTSDVVDADADIDAAHARFIIVAKPPRYTRLRKKRSEDYHQMK